MRRLLLRVTGGTRGTWTAVHRGRANTATHTQDKLRPAPVAQDGSGRGAVDVPQLRTAINRFREQPAVGAACAGTATAAWNAHFCHVCQLAPEWRDVKPSVLTDFCARVRCFTGHRAAENPARSKAHAEQPVLLFILCSKGETWPSSTKAPAKKVHRTFYAVLNEAAVSSAAAPPASCSLVPGLPEQLFCAQTQLLGALGAERPTMPAQLRVFPLDQRVLTLPGDTLSWKAYQDALLSIALSHPLHRKASKSPWIFFCRDETVIFCIINRRIVNAEYKFHSDNMQLY